ncbi:RNA-binding domain-containing protein [Thermothelomyces heterothallicus CBS 203.75]
MDRGLDRSLDEILEERKQNNRSSRGGRRRDRSDYPRDGARKSFRDDAPRNLDSEWVHDKFEDYGTRRSAPRRRYSPEPTSETRGTKLRVDNLHYELTQEDLEDLFSRIGPLISLEMKYDRAGRSEGTAFVTYESHRDALQAIREYDGANAAGQPIRLTLLPGGPSAGASRGGGRSGNHPFDSSANAGRPLAERITVPGQGRSRSLSPHRRGPGGGGGGGGRDSDEEAARRGVDRYRPRGGGGSGRLSRSRSPIGGRGGGGRRRDGGGGGGRRSGARGNRGGGSDRSARPKKTQEELDAEMEDYFNSGSGGGGGAAQQSEGAVAGAAAGANGAVAQQQQQQQQQNLGEDIDMIE